MGDISNIKITDPMPDDITPVEAYMLGVRETAQITPIFVDFDLLLAVMEGRASEKSFRNHLEDQVSGADDAFYEDVAGDPRINLLESFVRDQVKNGSPAVLNIPIKIEETDYRFTVLPTKENWHTKEAYIKQWTPFLSEEEQAAILSNTTDITIQQLLRHNGNHEGGHAREEAYGSTLGILKSETYADRVAARAAEGRGETHVNDFILDLRNIRTPFANKPTHATGALLISNDQVYNAHLYGADATRILVGSTAYRLSEKSYVPRDEVIRANPKGFFAALNERLETDIESAVMQYQKSPEILVIQQEILEAQITADYVEGFENAYLGRVLGEDVPDRVPNQLIPQALEERYAAFYEATDQEKLRFIDEVIAAKYDDTSSAICYDMGLGIARRAYQNDPSHENKATLVEAIYAHAYGTEDWDRQYLLTEEEILQFHHEDLQKQAATAQNHDVAAAEQSELNTQFSEATYDPAKPIDIIHAICAQITSGAAITPENNDPASEHNRPRLAPVK